MGSRLQLIALVALVALAACNDASDEQHRVFDKGCYGKGPNCGYTGDTSSSSSSGATPGDASAAVPAEGCPKTRTDGARAVSSADLHALLVGRWRSCVDGTELVIRIDADGRLDANGDLLTIGACGETSCPVGWGTEGIGSMRVWADPSAFEFTLDSIVDGYVRIPEP